MKKLFYLTRVAKKCQTDLLCRHRHYTLTAPLDVKCSSRVIQEKKIQHCLFSPSLWEDSENIKCDALVALESILTSSSFSHFIVLEKLILILNTFWSHCLNCVILGSFYSKIKPNALYIYCSPHYRHYVHLTVSNCNIISLLQIPLNKPWDHLTSGTDLQSNRTKVTSLWKVSNIYNCRQDESL